MAARAPRIYMIAGEASGDLHGGNLVRALKALDPQLQIRAWGGDHMAEAGAEVVEHYRDHAFMGFTQVVLNLRTILRNIRRCYDDIIAFKPDAVVLIDYPGFNLRIAERLHAVGIPVHYYISPQLWAWKAGRVRTIKRVVQRMYVILPFEKDWYARHDMDVDFVGHSLLDAIAREPFRPLPQVDDRPLVALLPGSRVQEIERMLPAMLDVVEAEPEHRFVVAGAPSLPDELYRRIIGRRDVEVVKGRTYDLLRSARAALVTSGTATLETALFGVPQAVCYRGGAINIWIAKRLIKVPFISLVNLIVGREVVRELIQRDLTVGPLRKEMHRLLHDEDYRRSISEGYGQLATLLGGPGASARVAEAVWKSLPPRP